MGRQTQVEKQPSTSETRHAKQNREDVEAQQDAVVAAAEIVDPGVQEVCDSADVTLAGIKEVLKQFSAS